MKKASLLIIIPLLGLTGLYITGNFILPGTITSSYKDKNCNQALSRSAIYIWMYSAFASDQSIQDLTKECTTYMLAIKSEEKRAWADAYDAYETYKQAYPHGTLIDEANKRSVLALASSVQDDITSQKYDVALKNALLLQKNSITNPQTADEANRFIFRIYSSWIKDLRKSGNFAEAESKTKSFDGWAQNIKSKKYAQYAQLELAQTYLAWSLSMQSQKQFESAKAKLTLTISTDPKPLAKSGPAALAKAAEALLYAEWGDALLASGKSKDAIKHYQTSLALATEPDEQVKVKEKITTSSLQLAVNTSDEGNFLGALKEVDEIEKNATVTNENKKAIADTRDQIYLAFSLSSGQQALDAIQDATQAICDDRKPNLPIFGINKEDIKAVLYGLPGGSLAKDISAKTPGSLHYILCVQEEFTVVESKIFKFEYVITRELCHWHLTLWDVTQTIVVATTTLDGEMPGPMPEYTNENSRAFHFGTIPSHVYGPAPHLSDLENWLRANIK